MIGCKEGNQGAIFAETEGAGGNGRDVPRLEARALALSFDTLLAGLLVVLLTIALRWEDFRDEIIRPIRLEVEDFDIRGSIIYPSFRASSWCSVFWRDSRNSDLHTVFNGPEGRYDVRIRVKPGEIFPTEVKIWFGKDQTAKLMATSESFSWEILVVPNVHLATGDIIRIIARSYFFFDYIELTPHKDPISYLRYYGDGGIVRHFIPGLDTQKVSRWQFFRVGASLVFCVWIFHIVLFGVFGVTPGSLLVGYRMRRTSGGQVRSRGCLGFSGSIFRICWPL